MKNKKAINQNQMKNKICVCLYSDF